MYNTICTLLFPFRFLCFTKANDSQRERDWVTVWHYSSSWRPRSDTRLQTTSIHAHSHTHSQTSRHRICRRMLPGRVSIYKNGAIIYPSAIHSRQTTETSPSSSIVHISSASLRPISLCLLTYYLSGLFGVNMRLHRVCMSFHCQFNVRCYIVNTKLDQSEQHFKIENHWGWRCFGVKI